MFPSKEGEFRSVLGSHLQTNFNYRPVIHFLCECKKVSEIVLKKIGKGAVCFDIIVKFGE